jgi:hypothetical protein
MPAVGYIPLLGILSPPEQAQRAIAQIDFRAGPIGKPPEYSS